MNLKEASDKNDFLSIASMPASIKYNEKTGTLIFPNGEHVTYNSKTNTIIFPDGRTGQLDTKTGYIHSDTLGTAQIDWRTGQIYDKGFFKNANDAVNEKYQNPLISEKKQPPKEAGHQITDAAAEGFALVFTNLLIIYGVYLLFFYPFYKWSMRILEGKIKGITIVLLIGLVVMAVMAVYKIREDKFFYSYGVTYVINLFCGSVFCFYYLSSTVKTIIHTLSVVVMSVMALSPADGSGLIKFALYLFASILGGSLALAIALVVPFSIFIIAFLANRMIYKSVKAVFGSRK